MQRTNNKTALKGILENAGLGEFSYYMNKSSRYAQYAGYALENTNFDSIKDCPATLKVKIDNLRKLAAEIVNEIETLSINASEAVIEHEENENERKDSEKRSDEQNALLQTRNSSRNKLNGFFESGDDTVR